jgi:hypothetical protein
MRILALAVLAVGTLLAASSVRAQTFAPGYPVCLHVYGQVTYYECSYNTLSQCNISASGRAAQCVVNPYYANAAIPGPVPRYHRRHYYGY